MEVEEADGLISKHNINRKRKQMPIPLQEEHSSSIAAAIMKIKNNV